MERSDSMTEDTSLSRLDRHIAEQDRVLAVHRDAQISVKELVEKLVGLRQVQGITLEQVARHTGDSVESIQSLEVWSGDPKLSIILRYAQAVGAHVEMTPRLSRGEGY